MKIKLNITFLLLSFLIPGAAVMAQGSQTECREQLRSAFERFQQWDADGAKVRYLRYTMTISAAPAAASAPPPVTMEIVAGRGQVWMLSPNTEVYQDSLATYVVLPARKMLMVRHASALAGQDRQMRMLRMLQDSLLRVATVESCGPAAGRSGLREAVLRLDEDAGAKFPFSGLRIIYDAVAGRIHTIFILYDSGRVTSVKLEFNEIDYDYRAITLNRPLESKFFDGDKNLLPQYAGYRLHDFRKNSQ